MSEIETTIGRLNCVIVQQQPEVPPKAAVILCHGFGAPGEDLVPVAYEMMQTQPELQDAAFVFPQAPLELDPDYDGRAWWMIDVMRLQYLMATGQTREMRDVSPPDLPNCREDINLIIEWTGSEWKLPQSQVVVGGFSQGAMLATDVALQENSTLGGLVIWSGALICQSVWQTAARQRKSLNVVQSHGQQDPILSFEGAVELKELLSEAGHSVSFFPFPGPHTISRQALQEAAKLVRKAIP